MKNWNEWFEGVVFSPDRLAPELPVSATTPELAFPSYFISDSMPFVPDNWSLKVGDEVERPTLFSLDQLMSLPRTAIRVRHHCVEGWSAVASWHGVRLSEIAKRVGISPSAK